MSNMWQSVNQTIKKADLLVVVLDARFIQETMNEEITAKINSHYKPYIFAVTKSDLAGKIDKLTIPRPYVLVSAKKRTGKKSLRERILIEGEKKYGKYHDIRVGVLGYPNVGKSSVINLLKGKHSASTSSLSGHTKREQPIRADRRILLLDTPGVIPYGERDITKHVVIGTKDFASVKHPEVALEGIMKKYPGAIEKEFGVEPGEKHSETIERIALKKNLLLKGGVPDVVRLSRMVIMRIQSGKLRL